MSSFLTAKCRIFQAVMNVGMRLLPWRMPICVEGMGAVDGIPGLLSACGAHKPMVVTGPRLYREGVAGRVTKVLDNAGIPYSVFFDVEADPSVGTVEAIRAQYVRDGCSGFIAVGGGSPMDAAKAAAARIARPRKTVRRLGGILRVRKKIPPFLAVPTTAGTGSETSIAAVVSDPDTHQKYAMMDLALIPLYAVLDPALTVGLPPAITAYTGMDALTHAVEAYLCRTYNTQKSLRSAEEAVRLIFGNLEKAYADGNDMRARSNMLRASYRAGYAFTRAGVGNVHAIAHTVGGLYNVSHGLANAVLLPIVLEDYGRAVYAKLSRLADIAGIPAQGGEEARARAFIAEIRAMNARMGVPARFDCIRDSDIDRMIEWALAEANPFYPVPVVYDNARIRSVIDRARGIDKN